MKKLTLHSSLRDAVPYLANRVFDRVLEANSTVSSRLLARWWNVRLGRGCRFTGIPYFRKHPEGTIKIGERCAFRSSERSNSIGLNRRCFLDVGAGAEIEIGNGSGFSGTIISALSSVRIGSNVLCGGNCTICDSNRHALDFRGRRDNAAGEASPIVIGDDVFLGMNVVVFKGVTIGHRTVVAANSVVTSSLPDDVLAGGSPARVIRSLAQVKP